MSFVTLEMAEEALSRKPTKTWREELRDIKDPSGQYFISYLGQNEIKALEQFISDLISQTREETIKEVGNSIKSFLYSLDDTNDEPFNKGIIQIDLDLVDKQINDILNKLKKYGRTIPKIYKSRIYSSRS